MYRTLTSLLCLVLPAAAAQDAPFQPPQAAHLIRIEYSPGVLPLSPDTIEALLNSAAIRGAVLQQAVQGGAAEREGVQLDFERVGDARPTMLVGHLTVRGLPGRDAAADVLDAVFARLREALLQASAADRESIERQFGEARQEFAQAEEDYARLQEAQNALREQAGRTDMNPDLIGEEISELRSQLRRIELDMVAAKAREAALAEQIAQVATQIKQRLGEDTVVHELEVVLNIKQQELERTRALVEGGQASEGDLLAVLEAVARTRAELAERRYAAEMQAGGGRLAELNAELASLAAQTAEAEARMAWLTAELEAVQQRDLLRLASEFERTAMQREITRDRLQSAASRVRDIERELHGYRQPQVTIIGAAAQP